MKSKATFYPLVFLLVFLISSSTFAQFVNNGATIVIQNNAQFYVNGNFSNQSGSILNLGNLLLRGNWSNDDSQGAFDPASTGTVTFFGQNQTIGGSQTTIFPSVLLLGSGSAKKTLLTNTSINGTLNLTDREFALENRNLNFLKKDSSGISLSDSGFISTDLKGILYRSTNSSSSYIFPLGSKATPMGTLRFRPVVLKTKDNLDNIFGVTFGNEDPTLAGYNRDQKRYDVNEVNPFYFHILDQKSGASAADFDFYYNNSGDGNFNQLVNWIRFNLWEKAGISNPHPFSSTTNPELNYVMTYSSLQTINSLPIAMSTILSANDPLTFFNSFTPDGDGTNDRWEIKNIDLFPDNELTILNRWGSEIYKANGYTNGSAWDGLGLNNGTYFYLLKVNVNGESKVYKGFITLLRK